MIWKYDLTKTTELSPCREAASYVTTQEPSSNSWNPKVHYRVHNSPPPVPILSQIDSVFTTLSYVSKIDLNIIHPLTS
jgi:hypothetical protein